MDRPTSDALPPLARAQRRRGRRLAITSHPFGMTFQTVLTQPLPTLALLSLGASETEVGFQSACVFGFLVLQLPTLRAVARWPKRRILVTAHLVAVAATLPLLAFRLLAETGAGLPVALASFAALAAAVSVSNTVWFPLLRGYVEPERIGRFFGTLRTGWHLTLIVFFLASQAWLARHPDDFAPLFWIAFACGLARIPLIARMPERSERTGERIRVREALALAREPRMRRYLLGVAWGQAGRATTVPFAMVMLQREVGLPDSALVLATAAIFAGGLASLYLWGRLVDRTGAAPVFTGCSLGMGGLVLALAVAGGSGSVTLAGAVAFFFLYAALHAGFGVADTHVLFGLTPDHAPSRALVLGSVAVGGIAGLAPLLAGAVLDAALAGGAAPLEVYRDFFLALGALQGLAFLPLRGFTDGRAA